MLPICFLTLSFTNLFLLNQCTASMLKHLKPNAISLRLESRQQEWLSILFQLQALASHTCFVYCELLPLRFCSQVDSQYSRELKHSTLLYKPINLGCNILQLHAPHISAPSSVTELKLHLDVHCCQLGGQIPKYIRHCHRFHSLPSFTGITSEGRGSFCSGNPWNI